MKRLRYFKEIAAVVKDAEFDTLYSLLGKLPKLHQTVTTDAPKGEELLNKEMSLGALANNYVEEDENIDNSFAKTPDYERATRSGSFGDFTAPEGNVDLALDSTMEHSDQETSGASVGGLGMNYHHYHYHPMMMKVAIKR